MSLQPDQKIAPVVKTVLVRCTPEEAFRYFTADFGQWWPVATHSVVAYASGFRDKPAAVFLESRQGGRLIEQGQGGEEYVWGTVLSWEPPTAFSFSWHPGRDATTAQTVEIRFSATAKGTEVMLRHDGWERFGANAEQERDGYNEGWEAVFVVAYAEYANR